MNKNFNLENHFIIAMPSLKDPGFNNSVTYLCKHDDEGAFGIIINRPSELKLRDVFEQFNVKNYRDNAANTMVYYGGPVDRARGFVIHNTDKTWENTLQITNDISLTMSKDILLDIAHGNGPEHSFFALGYAGWEPGQLETEIKENSWLNVPADKHIIFNLEANDRWQHACQLLGINVNHLSDYSGHA